MIIQDTPTISDAVAGAFRAIGELKREVVADSFNVQVHDGLGAFCGLKEGHVLLVIHCGDNG